MGKFINVLSSQSIYECCDVRALYWGDKRDLAMAVCDVWAEAAITAENLYIELSLICPSWFSAMLSQRYGEQQMRLLKNIYFKDAITMFPIL